MPTSWFLPSNITQFAEAESHISWDSANNFFELMKDTGYLKTTKDLLHISNREVNDLKMKTWFLILKNFSFSNLPGSISGIEVELNMRRGGRITDDTIQLCYNDIAIGDNLANSSLDEIKVYGSATSLWGITENINLDPNFGIMLRFQSHPSWPHKTTPMINYARIRIW